MEAWKGRIALVTGASSGIGFAIAQIFVQNGMIVVGCARNVESIEEAVRSLPDSDKGNLHPFRCDITKEDQVANIMQYIKDKFGVLDVLVNNAGMGGDAPLSEGPSEQWQAMLQLNIFGLSVCTKEAVKLMTRKDAAPVGHVININSYIGHHMVKRPGSQFYSATKHMVTALTDALRKQLQESNIRVTSLSPGVTETQFMVRAAGAEEAKKFYSSFKVLEPIDVANAAWFVISAPPHVNVDELTLTAHKQTLF